MTQAPSLDESEWDRFVGASEASTFCHLSGWRSIIQDALGHETHYLTARGDDGGLTGVLPLVRVKSRLFGHYLISVPFLNYGGPLGDEASRAQLCSQALELARKLDVDLLEIRARDVSPPGLNPAARKIAVLLPLPGSAEELWEKGFRSKLRGKIKRPINHGMEVRFGRAELEPFYEIFARNMRDLGTPVLPRSWFETIAATLSDQVIFASVYLKETAVAAGCGFLWQKEFELTWSSGLREYNSQHPNMLLCWSLMQETIRRGGNCFNFGRSTPDSSTHHFKEQWGGHNIPLPWGASGKRLTPPTPTSAKYRLARNLWMRLPVPLSKRFGPPLARQLP